MNTQEKINKIYEVIADKTLSFGCIGKDSLGRSYISSSLYTHNNEKIEWCRREREDGETDFYPTKIIGHPVMIGNVLGRIDKQSQEHKRRSEPGELQEVVFNVFDWWWDMAQGIEEQSSDCIDFIYSLIANTQRNRV